MSYVITIFLSYPQCKLQLNETYIADPIERRQGAHLRNSPKRNQIAANILVERPIWAIYHAFLNRTDNESAIVLMRQLMEVALHAANSLPIPAPGLQYAHSGDYFHSLFATDRMKAW